MRLLPAIVPAIVLVTLALTSALTTACRPVLPPEVLAALTPDRLQLTQNVAAALQPATSDSIFVALFPELRSAPAPAWLRPATRVIYSLATATFARSQDDPTPSSAGLVEYDVIAQNRRNVVFLSSFLNTQIAGTRPTPLSNRVEIPGVGAFWISPQVLQNAEAAQSENFQVARLPLDIGDITYNVVRMQSNTVTDQGRGEEVWAFDTTTGIVVFYRQALYGLDGVQTSGITMSLLGKRQLRLPWRSGTVPDWVKKGVTLQFGGNQTLDVGVGQPTSLPMSSFGQVTRVGALWSEHRQQEYLYGRDNGQSTSATGTMQLFGGYWLPAEAIAVLETGAVLDSDPITGIQTSVVQADSRQIVLAAAGSGFVTQLYYNASDGRLIGIYIEEQSPTGALYTTMQAVQ